MSEDAQNESPTLFCCRCLADARTGGSWKGGVVDGYCMNCGAADSTVTLPFWVIESIRAHASWVCKRYYPDPEDIQIHNEITALRKLVPPPVGDQAEFDSELGTWCVSRTIGKVRHGICGIKASDEADALRKGHAMLPYPIGT